MSSTDYGLRVPRPTWLTSGAIRLGILAAFIVAIGMLPGELTRERAIVLLVVAVGAAVVGAILFLGGARRLSRTVNLPDASERMAAAVLVEVRRIGLPLLGLAFFLVWTFVYMTLWAVHPDEAFGGLAAKPKFADFFYYAVSTAFTSPPEGIAATSRGSRSATMIELLTALALLSAYVGSFVDFQRRAGGDHLESTSERSLSPRPDRHTST